jgi:hypothetical protein
MVNENGRTTATRSEDSSMYGIDQIIVSLWFLPVTLFIIVPLTFACLWGSLSLLAGLVRQKGAQPAVPLALPRPV